ncbi:hypothetical protein DMH03_33655 [Amycolatopsis sp. WAC 01376]|nr:hypothetical protein DMH03_33655 [Amycolatopsis sp. WAC 01376]
MRSERPLGPDAHVARPSAGIGAGNPGGGTFHAVIFESEGGHAFSLIDDPFERGPQGGSSRVRSVGIAVEWRHGRTSGL